MYSSKKGVPRILYLISPIAKGVMNCWEVWFATVRVFEVWFVLLLLVMLRTFAIVR